MKLIENKFVWWFLFAVFLYFGLAALYRLLIVGKPKLSSYRSYTVGEDHYTSEPFQEYRKGSLWVLSNISTSKAEKLYMLLRFFYWHPFGKWESDQVAKTLYQDQDVMKWLVQVCEAYSIPQGSILLFQKDNLERIKITFSDKREKYLIEGEIYSEQELMSLYQQPRKADNDTEK